MILGLVIQTLLHINTGDRIRCLGRQRQLVRA